MAIAKVLDSVFAECDGFHSMFVAIPCLSLWYLFKADFTTLLSDNYLFDVCIGMDFFFWLNLLLSFFLFHFKTRDAMSSALAKSNYFRRWSHRLSWSQHLRYPFINVGVEGCGTGFNATNAIRSCLCFSTPPPQFLRAKGFDDIFKLETDHESQGHDLLLDSFENSSEIARFGAEFNDPSLPVVALENFAERARPLDEVVPILPHAFNLVVGHENDGVARKWLDKAEYITYIPQYGTISSINLVSALGIFLHSVVRQRQLREQTSPAVESSQLEFMRVFEKPLPKSPFGGRIESRPIHPHFYGLSVNQMQKAYKALTDSVLPDINSNEIGRTRAFSEGRTQSIGAEKQAPVGLPFDTNEKFRVGVLFENYEDTRNLGGIIRLANAFLAPVFYLGRRKINRRGAVGTENFTPITYLGPGRWSAESSKPWDAKGNKSNPHDADSALRELIRVEIVERRRMALWWLDCEQSSLWSSDDKGIVAAHVLPSVSLTASTRELKEFIQRMRILSPGGIMLCIPQEGMCPGVDILQQCTGRLHLGLDTRGHRGMPSQVAVGIALQRLLESILSLR